jgi:hypothetical protein
LLGSSLAAPAFADAPAPDVVAPPAQPPHDIREEVPLLAYTTSAFGASRMTMGALGYGGVLGAPAASSPGTGLVNSLSGGGGARIWGSPVDRLTIVLEVARPLDDKACGGAGKPCIPANAAKPSASVIGRLLGSRQAGMALSAELTYRTDGFADFGGEVEGSMLFSLARSGLHLDSNVTFGGAVDPDEREADGEVKLRLGYDVTSWFRVGLDGRFRYRLLGEQTLPGNRLGDAVGGPELLFSYKHLFVAVDGGPSTVGVARGVGGTVLGTLGTALW